MSNTKQVIVIRRDIKMRRGKEIAQGSHGATSWMAKEMKDSFLQKRPVNLTQEQFNWISGDFTKICLQIGSEHELMELAHKAKMAGLNIHVITDAGKTEFNGIPTVTCLCIGPHESSKIDVLTSHLSLY